MRTILHVSDIPEGVRLGESTCAGIKMPGSEIVRLCLEVPIFASESKRIRTVKGTVLLSYGYIFLRDKRTVPLAVLTRYPVRARKSDCLHDDVENLMFHCQLDASRLVDILLNNELVLARYTDPTYPA